MSRTTVSRSSRLIYCKSVMFQERPVQGTDIWKSSLLRDFVAFTATPSLIGTDFVSNSPDFFSDLWAMNRGFLYLSTGLPRWFPFPPLTSAHLARRRMLSTISRFEAAMENELGGHDAGSEWHSLLDDVSPLVAARAAIYRKHGLSIPARSSLTASLLWAMNAKPNPLLSWLLLHIYADPSLLASLRAEVAPYVPLAARSAQAFPIPEPVRLQSIDHDGLTNHCPLLRSCYLETLRLDTASHSFRIMGSQEDRVLAPAAAGGGAKAQRPSYLLGKGSFVHVAHDMQHKNPAVYEDSLTWRPDRHVVRVTDKDGAEWVSVNMGGLRPFGTYIYMLDAKTLPRNFFVSSP